MKDRQFKEPYKSNTEKLKATIAAQRETISLLETQLYNEKLKNANLSDWAKGSLAKSKKTVED
jgi:hypothetical protein